MSSAAIAPTVPRSSAQLIFGRCASGFSSAIILFLCVSVLAALEMPSKPFLDKNSFYLSSAGFRVHFANDADAKKALHALPPHRFVIHSLGKVQQDMEKDRQFRDRVELARRELVAP